MRILLNLCCIDNEQINNWATLRTRHFHPRHYCSATFLSTTFWSWHFDRDIFATTFLMGPFCDVVRSDSLGIILNQMLNFSAHVYHLTHCCYNQPHSLSRDAAATLVHNFFTSRLHHCCSVSVGLPLTPRSSLSFHCPPHCIGFSFKSASVTE